MCDLEREFWNSRRRVCVCEVKVTFFYVFFFFFGFLIKKVMWNLIFVLLNEILSIIITSDHPAVYDTVMYSLSSLLSFVKDLL